MKRIAIAVASVLALGVAIAYAQVYTGQPNPVALVCAYNSSVPTPVAGKFFYVQCNSSGQIVVQ